MTQPTYDEEARAVYGPRRVLVHLNVEVAPDDTRPADEIADALVEAANTMARDLHAECSLAEEV